MTKTRVHGHAAARPRRERPTSGTTAPPRLAHARTCAPHERARAGSPRADGRVRTARLRRATANARGAIVPTVPARRRRTPRPPARLAPRHRPCPPARREARCRLVEEALRHRGVMDGRYRASRRRRRGAPIAAARPAARRRAPLSVVLGLLVAGDLVLPDRVRGPCRRTACRHCPRTRAPRARSRRLRTLPASRSSRGCRTPRRSGSPSPAVPCRRGCARPAPRDADRSDRDSVAATAMSLVCASRSSDRR